MLYLRQSTASQEIPLGYFVDSTDGNTAMTGLTIANTDIDIWKTGATTLADKNSGGATHIAGGIYYTVLDATDTNTIGPLVVFVKVAGALAVRVECCVLDEAVYDALFGTVALATTTNITAGTITTATNVTTVNGLASGVITATSIAADALTAAKFASDVTTELQSGLATAAELAKVPKSDGTATWNATALAAIQSEANDALVAYDPPTKAELDAAVANVSVDEIQATALADLFNTDSGTTYASAVAGSVVKEIADNAGGSSLTAAEIADAVWDEDATGHQTGGTFGQAIGDPGASTETLFKAIITDPAGTNIAADVIALKAETAAIVADTNELQTDWVNGGRLDLILDARASQTSVDTIDDFLDTEVAAILADTNELQTDWANGGRLDLILDARASQASVDTIDGIVDSILVDTAEIGAAGAGLTAVPWNAAWDAEVESEVTDALNAYDPPTKAELDAAVANVSVDEIQATALADLFNTDSGTTYASAVAGSVVKEIADNAGGSALTAAAIADAVWDEAQADHVGVGTFGIVASEIADILVDTSTTLQAELDGIQADTEDIQTRLPAALVSGRIDASVGAMAADVMTAAAAAADLTTELQSGLATAASLATVAGYLDTEIAAILADTNELQTDLVNGGRLDLLIDAIKAKTDALSATPAQDVWEYVTRTLTALDEDSTTLDLNATILAAVGLATGNLDTQLADIEGKVDDLEIRLGIPSDLGSGATVAANLVDIEAQTDNLPAIETKIDTIDGIVDSILIDTAEIGLAGAGLTEAGGTGDHLTAINLPDQTMNITGDITGNLSGSVGSVTGAVGSVTGNVGGSVGSVTGAINTAAGVITTLDALDTAQDSQHSTTQTAIDALPTAAENADAVWEELIADHTATAGSTAESLNAAGSAGDPWTTALPGAYGAGSAGKIIGDNINATISSRATQASVDTIDGIVDAILVDTAEIGVAGAGLTNIDLPDQTMNITGNISGSVGSVTGAVGSVTGNVGGNVTGSIGSLAAQAKLDVNTEVNTALADYDAPTKAELDTAEASLRTDIINTQAVIFSK